ncbi:hypothetical protein lerEdw1_014365 [Lerista edwardsae]|nr:hypothetical protein lerEdw1_014365 [Lerista edwardsae]
MKPVLIFVLAGCLLMQPGAVGIFNIISKECTSSCKEYYKDFTVGKRNTTCCTTELCNFNGSGSIRASHVQVALAALASFACLFFRSGL